ncbi:MAG: alcohol dehydrogenase catalytic domain-containing protein [Proteobacteria bacterium]|nr:alcohol dehydrogenase catalytic domain-containing protein [Pseudomonadota bacterium]
MRALVLTEEGPEAVDDRPEPNHPGEALIELTCGGVCATDLELVKGYMGYTGVLGHEWVGRVAEHPDPAWVGARVVGDINCVCGVCATCVAGRPTHCEDRTVFGIQNRDGAFSERFALPAANLHVVPAGVPDEAAVFVEPLAAACEILQQVHVRPTDVAVVLGVGRLGQLVARVLALTGATVIAVSRNPDRLKLLPKSVRGLTLDEVEQASGADLVVDCTGSADGLQQATSLVRPRGTIVMKTTIHDVGSLTPIPWVIDEVTLVGSRCGPFAPALRLLAAGLVDPTPLITHRYGLDDGVEALDVAASRNSVKVLLTP